MAENLVYKCPCCGGTIEYNSTEQKMKCPYCDTEFELDTLKEFDDVLREDGEDNMDLSDSAERLWQEGEADGVRIYLCESCAGEIICEETTSAALCPYCGNPTIMTGNLKGELCPDYVIPFKLDKNAAKKALSEHFRGKKLLPRCFAEENHIDEIKGIYVPFWLFSANSCGHMRFKGTKVRTWSDSNYIYTDTRYFSVVRAGRAEFLRVPVDGSKKMPNDLMESLEPYDFSEAVDFRTAYLSGFLADKYDVDKIESSKRANERIKNSTESALRETAFGYNTLITESSSVKTANSSAKYALYPVWLLNTTWKGEKYVFAMNGQTGKLVGNLPTDWGAYWRWFFSIAGISTAITIAIGFLLGLM